ncbi:MAG: 4-hydroxybutyrate CoA-transferase [bacterium TMED88]|nr:4-hydroxybutyrate CoA-transferase [Deltaproteobacteria bacterium]OUV27622.1 MAG: 4-hydroxybutyrate CoA-transferase [bacterium TMED88]
MPTPIIESATEAIQRVRSRDTLAVPLGPGQPPGFLTALGERDDFEDLEINTGLLLGLYPIFTRKGVRLRSGFFGPAERGLVAGGHDVSFIPADFRRFAVALEMNPPRVMATAVAPPDESGHLSLSLHAGATIEALHACGRDPERLLIAEMNPSLPRTQGWLPEYPHRLSVEEVDVLIEHEGPAPLLPSDEPGAVEEAIADYAQAFIPDGATLQTGIGAIPSQVVSVLAEGGGGDYGIHSEMFTTGLMRLHREGKVTNRNKGTFDGRSLCTFALGDQALYDWLDESEEVAFLPVDVVNDPRRIGANRQMISINGALAIDLFGQVAADTLGPRQYSGIGGHEDFVEGVGSALANRSLLCLPSTTESQGQRISRIVPTLAAGTCVTTPRHQVDLVITECGVAELQGRIIGERAEALVQIAHPDFREELRRAL